PLGTGTSVFFFQAEDGIRDFHVTGVQTCALPISLPVFVTGFVLQVVLGTELGIIRPSVSSQATWGELIVPGFVLGSLSMAYVARSEERRVGAGWSARWLGCAYSKGTGSTGVWESF